MPNGVYTKIFEVREGKRSCARTEDVSYLFRCQLFDSDSFQTKFGVDMIDSDTVRIKSQKSHLFLEGEESHDLISTKRPFLRRRLKSLSGRG